jgi:hypothetical protein
LLYGTGAQKLTAPCRTIRLCIHSTYVVTGGTQGLEAWYGKLRGTRKNNAQLGSGHDVSFLVAINTTIPNVQVVFENENQTVAKIRSHQKTKSYLKIVLKLTRSHLYAGLFLQFLTNPVPFKWREVVDKQFAIQMIDFVLNTNRQQAISLHLEGFTRTI